MAWRLAKSLEVLRDQVNTKWPDRDKSSDGTIGDQAHAATNSDHNPNSADVVTALDITNDPAHGLVARSLAETLVASRDPRIKYIISNAQIISSVVSPWVWRPYTGSNAHREHVHFSVMADPDLYDDARPWIALSGEPSSGALTSGRGSWYSQHVGKFTWVDEGDEPGSAALGCPDSAQGISFYDRATLGKWFEVHAPNGKVSIEQQSDIGPHPNTGRKIDISAVAAERLGYSPRNFPTDSIFSWRPVSAPNVVAGLTPQQQAVKYAAMRTESQTMPTQSAAVIISPGQPVVQTQQSDARASLFEALLPLLPMLIQAIQQAGQPQQLVVQQPPPPPPPPAPIIIPPAPPPVVVIPEPPPPVIQNPSVQIGGFGMAIATVLQAIGFIGTPFGMGAEPTTTGTVATLVPALVGLTGLTGVYGTIANVALNFVAGRLRNRISQNQKPT